MTQVLAGLQKLFLTRKNPFSDIKSDGSAAVAAALSNLGLGAGSFTIGMPFFWPSSTPPNLLLPEWSGMVFLKFNNAAFSATTYPKLTQMFPSLVLPEARGVFPRIWDDGRGLDSGRALLSMQADAMRNFTGYIDAVYGQAGGNRGGPFYNNAVSPDRYNTTKSAGVDTYMNISFEPGRIVPVANENRPHNIAFNFFSEGSAMTLAFDENGHACEAGTIRVFHFSSTGEYRGWSDEFVPVGVSLPGSSTPIDPGEGVAGRAWVFDGKAWASWEDHRDETVYSTDNGGSSIVDYLGAIREGFTTLPPVTPFDKWTVDVWVLDQSAQHAAIVSHAAQQKNSLRAATDTQIVWLQDAVDLDIATIEEIALLKAWKTYRVQINRIDVNLAPNIKWPTPPDAQAS